MLSDEQVEELEKLGMNWSTSKYTRHSVPPKPARRKPEKNSEV